MNPERPPKHRQPYYSPSHPSYPIVQMNLEQPQQHRQPHYPPNHISRTLVPMNPERPQQHRQSYFSPSHSSRPLVPMNPERPQQQRQLYNPPNHSSRPVVPMNPERPQQQRQLYNPPIHSSRPVVPMNPERSQQQRQLYNPPIHSSRPVNAMNPERPYIPLSHQHPSNSLRLSHPTSSGSIRFSSPYHSAQSSCPRPFISSASRNSDYNDRFDNHNQHANQELPSNEDSSNSFSHSSRGITSPTAVLVTPPRQHLHSQADESRYPSRHSNNTMNYSSVRASLAKPSNSAASLNYSRQSSSQDKLSHGERSVSSTSSRGASSNAKSSLSPQNSTRVSQIPKASPYDDNAESDPNSYDPFNPGLDASSANDSTSTLPPLDHAESPVVSENVSKISSTDYLTKLNEWYKQITDYESQMTSYFQKSSTKLNLWKSELDMSKPENEKAYKVQFDKLDTEYQKFMVSIKGMKEHYAKQCAESSLGTTPHPVSTQALLSTPLISSSTAPVVSSVANKTLLPTPGAVVSSVTPVNSSVAPLPVDVTSESAVIKDPMKHYRDYYKQMKAYFQTYIKSIEKAKPPSTPAVDANGKKLTVNQRRKLRRKRKELERQQMMENDDEDYGEEDNDEVEDEPGRVMDTYLDRFGGQGEWNWSAWNHYMKNMAESSPEWYAMFVDQSKTLGIDWQEMNRYGAMFSTGIEEIGEDPVEPQRLEECVTSSGTDGESEEEDEGENGEKIPLTFCKSCDQRFPSERAYRIHLRGVRHAQIMLERKRVKHPDRYGAETRRQNAVIRLDVTKEEKHVEWIHSHLQDRSLGLLGTFHCEACNVTCTSEVDLETHLAGLRHEENLKIFQETGQRSATDARLSRQNAANDRRPKKITSRIDSLLNTCVQSLVGLNYLIEFQPLDPLTPCRYHCQLCYRDKRYTLLPDRVIGHLVDFNHRMRFMKYNYPDLYDIIRRDESSLLVQKKRLDIYAKKIEASCGRKRITILLEIDDEVRKITLRHQSESSATACLSQLERPISTSSSEDDGITNADRKGGREGLTVERPENFYPTDFEDPPGAIVADKPPLRVLKGTLDPEKAEYLNQLEHGSKLFLHSLSSWSFEQFESEADWAIKRKENGLGNTLSIRPKSTPNSNSNAMAAAAAAAHVFSIQLMSEKIRSMTGLGISMTTTDLASSTPSVTPSGAVGHDSVRQIQRLLAHIRKTLEGPAVERPQGLEAFGALQKLLPPQTSRHLDNYEQPTSDKDVVKNRPISSVQAIPVMISNSIPSIISSKSTPNVVPNSSTSTNYSTEQAVTLAKSVNNIQNIHVLASSADKPASFADFLRYQQEKQANCLQKTADLSDSDSNDSDDFPNLPSALPPRPPSPISLIDLLRQQASVERERIRISSKKSSRRSTSNSKDGTSRSDNTAASAQSTSEHTTLTSSVKPRISSVVCVPQPRSVTQTDSSLVTQQTKDAMMKASRKPFTVKQFHDSSKEAPPKRRSVDKRSFVSSSDDQKDSDGPDKKLRLISDQLNATKPQESPSQSDSFFDAYSLISQITGKSKDNPKSTISNESQNKPEDTKELSSSDTLPKDPVSSNEASPSVICSLSNDTKTSAAPAATQSKPRRSNLSAIAKLYGCNESNQPKPVQQQSPITSTPTSVSSSSLSGAAPDIDISGVDFDVDQLRAILGSVPTTPVIHRPQHPLLPGMISMDTSSQRPPDYFLGPAPGGLHFQHPAHRASMMMRPGGFGPPGMRPPLPIMRTPLPPYHPAYSATAVLLSRSPGFFLPGGLPGPSVSQTTDLPNWPGGGEISKLPHFP